MEIDRNVLKRFKAEAEVVLAKVAEAHGMKATFKGGTFSPAVATLKLEVAVVGPGGQVATKEAEAFKENARYLGMKASDLGKRIETDNGIYKIVGLRTRARKNPIIVERDDGKRFVLTTVAVTRALERAAPKAV